MIVAAALTFAAVSAQAIPTLSFTTPTVTNGSSVDVDFVATDIADFFGYGLSVYFDPALLSLTSVTAGSFLGTPDFGVILGGVPGVINYIYDGLYGTGPGATGSGTLFTLHFNTLATGTSLLTVSDLIAFDSDLADIAFTTTPGAVTILPVVVPPGPGSDVPEPASALLLGIGAAALLARRRGAAAAQLAA